jgi:predicted transcriptional regulator
MVKLPCQEVFWDLLPAIRATLAAALVRKGHFQLQAARLLDPAPGATSQYLSGKRGYRIEFDDDIRAGIELAPDELASGDAVAVPVRLCAISRPSASGQRRLRRACRSRGGASGPYYRPSQGTEAGR